MLRITVPEVENFNELTGEFCIVMEEQTLELEHSLYALSKWESTWNQPFFSAKDKTYEETIDYIKCMTINGNVNPEVYKYLTVNNVNQINEYINATMTATTFPKEPNKPSREIVTAELIYYWMIALNIPFECQHWHLSRLFTLIKVCNIKNQPPKKMGRRELMSRNAALNASRRQQLNSKG